MSVRSIPRGVIALGLVSLFMDVSSEMIHSLLPVFLVGVLGASALSVGFNEGVAEATAAISKVFSGVVSDWIGRRKPLVLLGYGMAALSKPIFPLAGSVGAVFAARFLDRIGKGIRVGMFNMVTGAALVGASSIAGVLWTAVGPGATFLAGTAFAALSLAGLLVFRPAPMARGGR